MRQMSNTVLEHAQESSRMKEWEACAEIADAIAKGYAPLPGEKLLDSYAMHLAQQGAERVAAAIREHFTRQADHLREPEE